MKVEKGDVYGIFSFGRKCPLIVEYGNFGEYIYDIFLHRK